jgi:selenide,water dikinase
MAKPEAPAPGHDHSKKKKDEQEVPRHEGMKTRSEFSKQLAAENCHQPKSVRIGMYVGRKSAADRHAAERNWRGADLTEQVKLTSMAKAAGCAAKLNPATLDAVLRKLPRQSDPHVLVGFDTNDDAGIYLLNKELALVQTVDFFTPIVDNPELFGQIAAANALSDVYAMGGKPISALSIVGFPEKGDPAILEQIIRGGLEKMKEAQCSVIGGHSIRNEDMLFGYAVTGVIHPERVWRNVGACTNDVLIFTKPLGTGVITTALKKDRATEQSLNAAIAAMTTLNGDAAEALREVEEGGGSSSPIHAVTDVTGFSLLGHAREMALGDPERGIESLSFEINYAAFAYFPGAVEAAREGHLSGGLKNNRAFVADCAAFKATVPAEYQDLLFDPQTSGGLLISIAPEAADAAIAALLRRRISASRIGHVVAKRTPLIQIS